MLEEDYERLIELHQVTEEITLIYLRMIAIETYGFKEQSSEFRFLVSKLKSMINLEGQLYKQLELTPQKAADIYDSDDYCEANFIEIITNGITDNNLSNLRISRNLYNVALPYFMSNEYSNSKDEDEYHDDMEDEESHILSDQEVMDLVISKKMEMAMDDDVTKGVFSFLLEDIDNYDDVYGIRYYLIRAKYILALTNPSIEAAMIDNNFSNNYSLYYTSEIIGKTLGLDSHDVANRKDSMALEIAYEIIDNPEYCNINLLKQYSYQAGKILSGCYLRAALLLLTDEKKIDEIVEDVEQNIASDDDEYNDYYEFNVYFEYLYDKLKSYKEDKKKCKYLFLR